MISVVAQKESKLAEKERTGFFQLLRLDQIVHHQRSQIVISYSGSHLTQESITFTLQLNL